MTTTAHPPLHSPEPESTTGPGAWQLEAECHLRQAGRALEVLGLIDDESARLAGIVYRLAQRVAVDTGRLARP
jgi:hypothetical protein